ncbi:MAG: hypothetical protein HKO93_02510, partial [Flavobacteriales bacterium]|nr:hypothetical protein [Flavobacteriales bacterium]
IIHREIYLDYNNGVYGNFGYTPVRREVQIEYFIDMETGEKLEFTQRNFERHFAYDPVLLNSFKEWNKRERKEGMFQFLHNYNQANPIYFPISRCRK